MDESKKIGYQKLPHTVKHYLNEYHLASTVQLITLEFVCYKCIVVFPAISM